MPHPLPPDPPLEISGELALQLDRAHLALGRLDGVADMLADTQLLLYAYVRKEAVLSSQIEGTQSSLSDLLLFELEEAPGAPLDDVIEVSNYVAALEHGLTRVREGFPISNRLIREMHAQLLSRGRGQHLSPGEFRRSQNWIGGTRPGNAHFVPPPPHEVDPSMSDLERFLNDSPSRTPTLLKAALTHVQFETIHPFLDGNGRLGRLLIPLLLCVEGVLRSPLLYLSLYFKQHRSQYYQLLDEVRHTGDWESWVEFFARGVEETATGAVAISLRMNQLTVADQASIQSLGRIAGSALQVHRAFMARPIGTIKRIAEQTGLSSPAVRDSVSALVELGLVREITGRKRGKVFLYEKYLGLLQQGDEPL